MSKLKRIALTLLLLFTLSACSEKKTAVSQTEEASAKLSDTEIQEQESAVSVCYEDKTFSSLEEYEKEFPEFQEKWFHPFEHLADFVTYDMIEEYGSFDRLAVPIGFECNYYIYALVDDNGFQFVLCIYPLEEMPDLSELPAITDVENNKDLRRSTENLGVYSVENIKYVYKEGKLKKIYWTSQNKAFDLAGRHYAWLESYSGEKPSLINSLLNAETAPAAIAEFNSKVSG